MLSRRDFLYRCGGAAVAAGMLGAFAEQAAPRPNIVWIYSDDHAQNAVSAYGGRLASVAPTPNIDRIAREGMIFRNSFVTNSLCGPCRAVVLTGLHSHLNGFRDNSDKFDGSQQTFPKLLQAAGYQTAVFGKWHLISEPTGFDQWAVLPGQGVYYNPEFLTPDGKREEQGYVTDVIMDKALHWLKDERDTDKPFMLMVQNKAPHREWEPGPKHLTTYDNVTFPEPETLFDDYATRGRPAHEQDMSIEKTMTLDSDLKMWTNENKEKNPSWKRTYGRLDEEQRKAWDAAYSPKIEAYEKAHLEGKDLVRWKYQRFLQDYMNCVASVDDNVGRMLDYLAESGLDKNTVVFYSSDQSFYLGEHGWFDKRFIYEESLRTPLVARWPGTIAPGSECAALVQNLDCAETFLNLAGVSVPGNMQGRSLVPLMRGETPPDWRGSVYYHYYEGVEKVHKVFKHDGVRTARYKLADFYTIGEREFYDLEKDPHELNNVYATPEYAEQVKTLEKELDRLRALYQVPPGDLVPG